MKFNLNRKQIIALVLTLIIIVMVVLFFIISRSGSEGNSTSEDEETIKIQNLKDYTKGRASNKEREKDIQRRLYLVVGNQGDDDEADYAERHVNVTDDFEIREGTFTHTEENGAHKVNFIIDSYKLRQSYEVQYMWLDARSTEQLDDWSTYVRCITDPNLIIFPEFNNCTDMFKMSRPAEYDIPIYKHLPYESNSVNISWNTNKEALRIRILLTYEENRIGKREASIEKYKKEADEWIRSLDLDPKDYKKDYIIEL